MEVAPHYKLLTLHSFRLFTLLKLLTLLKLFSLLTLLKLPTLLTLLILLTLLALLYTPILCMNILFHFDCLGQELKHCQRHNGPEG